MLFIERHRPVLERLKLDTLEGVKRYTGELVKDHRGRRDIFRIATLDETGGPLILFLKRNWKPYRKDGLASLLRHGRVWSIARQEWDNAKALERAGLCTPKAVAFGESCGSLWE